MSFRLLTVSMLLLVAACDGPPTPEPTPEEDIPKPQVVADEDYVVTESGMKVYDITVGDGDLASTGDQVAVHYHVWLTDGQFIDSSYLREAPFEFTLGTGFVIAGWDEGIPGMRVGGTRQLVIPPDLAYGDQGRGNIPPNATLIFQCQLVSVQ